MQDRLGRRRGRKRRAARLDDGHDVLLGDAALAAGALDLVEVDVVLLGDALDDRRVAARRAGAARRGGSRRRRGPRRRVRGGAGGGLGGGREPRAARRRWRGRRAVGSRSAARRGRAGRDARERHADVDRRADLHEDLDEPAGGRRRDLGVDLVGRDLGDRLVGVDLVAGLLVPLDDGALGDGHPHLGHRHVDERPGLSTRGADGRPPSRDRRTAAPRPRAAARTGSGSRASRRARPARRGRRRRARR